MKTRQLVSTKLVHLYLLQQTGNSS